MDIIRNTPSTLVGGESNLLGRERFDSLLELAGLSLFLATVEMLIPKPMPFLKLGIANLPILLFVRQLRYRELLLLIFLKVFCQSLITGTMLSYILVFSACASFVSGSAMWLLAQLPQKHFSLLGISILGAASSNGIQLLLALNYFFPGTGSLLIPWSLSFGLGSGMLLGLFALQFCQISQWYQHISKHFHTTTHSKTLEHPKSRTDEQSVFNSRVDSLTSWLSNAALRRFSFGIFSLALMFATNKFEPAYLGLELMLFLYLNTELGYRPWWRSMLLLFVTLVFFHLLLPSGRLLWELSWPPYIHWRLTQGALERGINKAFFLLNLIQISRFAVSRDLYLPGRLGHIIQLVYGYYEGFLNCPLKFRSTKPFVSLDAILCFLSNVKLTENVEIQTMDATGQAPLESPAPLKLPARSAEVASTRLNYLSLGLALMLQVSLLLLAIYFPLYRLLEL